MGRLEPLSEEPINEDEEECCWSAKNPKKGSVRQTWRKWIRSHLSLSLVMFGKRSDLKLLLSVLACPLFPLSPHPSLLNQVTN